MCFYLGTHKFMPTLGLLGDMGWFPMLHNHKIEILRLWNRFILMPNNRLTKRIFNWNVDDMGEWSSEVFRILSSVDMEHTFYNREICDIKAVSDKLKNNFKIEWQDKIIEKTKLRVYKTFKSELKTEQYVSSNISRSERSFFSQIRFGILPIHVDTGRFTRKPLEERLLSLRNDALLSVQDYNM